MSRVAQAQVHRPKRSGRWSPPLWGCYEYQTSGSEHDSECETCSGSEGESDSDNGDPRNRSESGSGSGSGSASESEEDAGEQAQRLKEKRKGKQPEGIRRKQRREPVYRPILTIRRSEGFVWNQDLFLPSYIRDRYIATSPNSSSFHSGGSANTSGCDSSFSGMDFEIECVDIHVDGKGILSGLDSASKPAEREQS
ncbi:hypothetical protein RSOLAG22IIIB_01987 [Rhizoctonia solani]|uniref:Uncharacterized protein n=1 Tax=Rhizoctonia solani TaxID=456999 RepID=A0A0K6GBL0_9AGAM|nr:hypothetical protein RSOLAG22IIIB_01987 [Rhizoctonia solani]